MEFYRINSLEELQAGYRGILEPSGETEKFLFRPGNADKTLMLMPGVAFDSYRNRIGYGKGFYDRYLADKEELQLHTIGIGFSCQLVDEIPAQEGDIKPYQVICV
jgi:5-formyltetrahydrofolate cyclo-ligase